MFRILRYLVEHSNRPLRTRNHTLKIDSWEPMQGKTVLITGSADGIGKQTALELARLGATVILHGRDFSRGNSVLQEIKKLTGNERLDLFIADLSSQKQIRKLAAEIQKKYTRLDVLVNNAGVYMRQRHMTEEGIEMTFAVNHLAPFLLTSLLLDLLRKSAPARIITVSSIAHQRARMDFDNLQAEKRFDAYNSYALSKLANILFTYELADRLNGSAVTATTLHPGVIDTKLLRIGFGSSGGGSLEEGAKTTVYLASSPLAADISGKYFVDCTQRASSSLSCDVKLRKKLWLKSEQLVGIAPV